MSNEIINKKVETEKLKFVPDIHTEYDSKKDEYITKIGKEPVFVISSDNLEALKNPTNLDKGQVLKNFRFLLEKSDYKIGDIEEESGNTKGYVSRLENPSNTSFPNLNFLTYVSKKFNVSMDDLLFGKLDAINPSEAMLINFSNKLIADTNKDKLQWNKIDSLKKKDYSRCSAEELRSIPLRDMAIDSINITVNGSKGPFLVCGDAYRAFLPDETNAVYIAHVEMQSALNSLMHSEYYEIFLENSSGDFIDVSKQAELNESLKLVLKRLHDVVVESTNHVHIGEKAKDIISNYMNLY